MALGVTLLGEFDDEFLDVLNTEISDGEVLVTVWEARGADSGSEHSSHGL